MLVGGGEPNEEQGVKSRGSGSRTSSASEGCREGKSSLVGGIEKFGMSGSKCYWVV